jgi:hypothetical protein
MRNGSVWWGEDTEETAREDAFTEIGKMVATTERLLP